MKSLKLSLGACALILALFAGCGGDDDDSGSDEPAPTKAEYITQADEICQTNLDEIGEAATALQEELNLEQGEQPSEEDQTAFAEDDVVPGLQTMVDELRDLTPPEGDEDTVGEIYDKLDEGLDELEDDPSLIVGDEGPAAFEESDQLATEYGMKVCGNA